MTRTRAIAMGMAGTLAGALALTLPLERFHNRYTARFFADALRSWMLLLWLERTVTICAGSF